MADLRIVDAPEIPTENITGEEKLPTGGSGNYSISLDSLADYTKTKKDLADNTSVDGKVSGVRQELETHIEDLLNPHQVTKGQIGLGNVDNTADLDKPVSNSTQASIISAVAPKVDKTYVDGQLALKANKVDVYTKLETYTKQESSDLVNSNISTALTPVNSSLDLARRGIVNRYNSSLTYNSGERVVINNGDIVVSTVGGNTANPNVDMTGWFNESLNLRENISRVKDAATIDLGYLKPPENFDISNTLQSILNLSSEKPINIVLPYGTFLMSQPISAPLNSKGASIDFNGATLKPTVGYTSPDGYAITLYSSTNFPIVLKNGELNGELRKQNLFEYTDYIAFQRDSTSGIHAKANTVIFENFKLKNLYGQTTKTECTHLHVLNSEVKNCGGHWYINDGYDAFGDLFYIGTGYTTSGIITASFENVIAHAKASNQYPENHQSGSPLTQVMYSRSGLVLENFGGTNNKVYVSYKNCDIQFTERGFHQEIEGINSYIYLENTRYDSCALFGSYLSETISGFATNCKFGFYGSEYNGSKGLVRGYSGQAKAKLNFCEVTNLSTDENYQMFGTSGNLEAYNTKFMGVSNLWSSSVTAKLVDCEVDVIKHSSLSYIAWESSFNMQSVNITYSGSESNVKDYADQLNFFSVLKNVTWSMVRPMIDTLAMGDKFENVKLIVPNDYSANFKGSRFRVVGKNGVIKNYPEILWGLPEQIVFNNRYVKEIHAKPSSGTLNLYTNAVKALLDRQSVAMIVAKGHDSAGTNIINSISETAYGSGYYVALIKKDSSQPNGIKMVQPFVSVGSTSGAGFDLTIDNSGNVTAYGGYSSYIHVCVFPDKERGTLPFVPDTMI